MLARPSIMMDSMIHYYRVSHNLSLQPQALCYVEPRIPWQMLHLAIYALASNLNVAYNQIQLHPHLRHPA